MKKRFSLLHGLIISVVGLALHAETTPLVNYQGKIKKNGTNLTGQVSITFKVFTGETNNDCVFEESQTVSVADGIYSTLIGGNPTSGSIQDACAQDSAYLEISIDSKPLKPREKFTPPPFAAKSEARWSLFGHSPTSALTSREFRDRTAADCLDQGLAAMARFDIGWFAGEVLGHAVFPPSTEKLTLKSADVSFFPFEGAIAEPNVQFERVHFSGPLIC